MSVHRLHIDSPSGRGHDASVTIDGEKTENLYAVKYEVTADGWATAQLSILPHSFKATGLAGITIDEATTAFLIKLGWTPPLEDK